MCFRLNHSGRLPGIIAGLYIFLATFLVGFFVVKLSSRVLWLDISGPESLSLLDTVRTPDTPGPGANIDGPLAIEYIQSEPAPDDYELDFMTGWPNFVFGHLRRPVTEKIFRRASTWI